MRHALNKYGIHIGILIAVGAAPFIAAICWIFAWRDAGHEREARGWLYFYAAAIIVSLMCWAYGMGRATA